MNRLILYFFLCLGLVTACNLSFTNYGGGDYLCRDCNKLRRLPSNTNWLQINDKNCSIVPSEVFSNFKIDTLIVYSEQVKYEQVFDSTNLVAFAQPFVIMKQIPSFIGLSSRAKSLVFFISDQDSIMQLPMYNNLEYIMLGIEVVADTLKSPLLLSPLLREIHILSRKGTVVWPKGHALPVNLSEFRAPIDLSENIGIFDGLDLLERISVTRISDIKTGVDYLKKLKKLKTIEVKDLPDEQFLLLQDAFPRMKWSSDEFELLPRGWKEEG